MHGLRQQIGQMVLVGCRAETLSAEEHLIFEEYGFGGFIFFQENCRAPRQVLSLCRTLWDAADDIPPFIAIDQEGGRVHRLPKPSHDFPAAGRLVRRRISGFAYRERQSRRRRAGFSRDQPRFRTRA